MAWIWPTLWSSSEFWSVCRRRQQVGVTIHRPVVDRCESRVLSNILLGFDRRWSRSCAVAILKRAAGWAHLWVNATHPVPRVASAGTGRRARVWFLPSARVRSSGVWPLRCPCVAGRRGGSWMRWRS
jgi:hypothetical protein